MPLYSPGGSLTGTANALLAFDASGIAGAAANLITGANRLDMRNGTNAQTISLHRTYIDPSTFGTTEIQQNASGGLVFNSRWIGSVTAPTNLLDVQANGTSQLRVSAGGQLLVSGIGHIGNQFGLIFGAIGLHYMKWGGSNFGLVLSNARMVGFGPAGFWSDESTPTVDIAYGRNSAGVAEFNNGTAGQFRDLKLRSLIQVPPASITPAANGDLVFEATSNTTATLKYRGSDGTVRSIAWTLA